MKRNRKNNIFGWLLGATLLLTTSCAGVADLDMAQTGVNGPNTVTFTIQSQSQTGGMRAANDFATGNSYIGQGAYADVLIFAVYVYDETDEVWKVAEKFGKGDQTKNKTLHLQDGQTAIDANIEDYPITLQFVFDDNAKYRVAFWAQNGTTSAYNLENGLDQVTIDYSSINNNDELSDAFCAVSEEVGLATKTTEKVTLHRPLAQVNVGTAGWDYEGAAFLKPSRTSYIYSTITLEGVAQCYNVLTGKAIVDETTHPKQKVTFKEDVLPAFIKAKEDDKWLDKLTYMPIYGEEMLRVHVRTEKGEKYEPYYSWEEFEKYRQKDSLYLKEGKMPDTEEFKYISMCYVLVPEGEDGNGSVLPSAEFTFKGIVAPDEDENPIYDEDEKVDLEKSFQVINVPVKKNWRTNILGNSFFTYSPKFTIDVVPDYMGDYNEIGTDSLTGGSWFGKEGNIYYLSFEGPYNNKNIISTFATDKIEYKGDFHDKYALNATYKGVSYNYGLKMNSNGLVKFKTDNSATVTIVQSVWEEADKTNPDITYRRTIKFDGAELPISMATTPNDTDNKNVRVYMLMNVPAGDHEILKGSGESGLFYVEVKENYIVDEKPPHKEDNAEFPTPEDY